MMATGDPRRWPNEPGAAGFVHFMDPTPYDYSFGSTDEERAANHLRYLRETIEAEGPKTIAAIIVESVTGTNGILPKPKGWFQGVRALCDEHGIVLIADEVMAGFGRTGRWFAFEHGGIVPDIVTMAKGLTSSYVPLGAMGVNAKIAEHFENNVFWGGLTYNAHTFALATADAVLDVMIEEDLVGNAARMQAVMQDEMARAKERHPSVRGWRNVGLFGIVELQKKRDGTYMAPFTGSHPAIKALNKRLLEDGVFTITPGSGVMCNPPLCIREDEIREVFGVLDRALAITDDAVEA
jgi:taurine--2-oxoglutarate transaminase